MMPSSELTYKFGDIVFHKTDGDAPGIVTGIMFVPGSLLYRVAWQGSTVECHWDCELTTDRPKFSSSEPENILS